MQRKIETVGDLRLALSAYRDDVPLMVCSIDDDYVMTDDGPAAADIMRLTGVGTTDFIMDSAKGITQQVVTLDIESYSLADLLGLGQGDDEE